MSRILDAATRVFESEFAKVMRADASANAWHVNVVCQEVSEEAAIACWLQSARERAFFKGGILEWHAMPALNVSVRRKCMLCGRKITTVKVTSSFIVRDSQA